MFKSWKYKVLIAKGEPQGSVLGSSDLHVALILKVITLCSWHYHWLNSVQLVENLKLSLKAHNRLINLKISMQSNKSCFSLQ